MNIATAQKPLRVLLDTNIIVSALVFGGKPSQILSLALERKIHVVTSAVLLAELVDVVNKKFPLSREDLRLFEKQAKKTFEIVNPKKQTNVLKDSADNRVLEAALEGSCDYIVTGDKELLDLKSFKDTKIITPAEFLKVIKYN